MDSIIIKGGNKLVGEIDISGAKNAALPIMTCALLTDDILELSNIPNITDINTMKTLLINHGVKVEHLGQEIKLSARNIDNLVAPYDIVRKMRASIWVLGPLLARFGEAKVSLPGGCAIGSRQVDLHLAGLEAMGAEISIDHGYIVAKTSKRLKGVHFTFDKISVGATANLVMASCLADGETKLINCAVEPEIVDLCNCLVKMGAKITGIGTNILVIQGQKSLHGAKHKIIPDRIEAGTYMIAAAITKGNLKIKNISYEMVENLGCKLIEAGVDIALEEDHFSVTRTGKILPVDIDTMPYPGYSTDLQAQFMALMTIADGVSTITENIFENRFMHVPELCRMGSNISINDHSAIVRGVDCLVGAEVMASDLRASVSLVLAGLVAEGETKVRRIYHIDRGYVDLEGKLQQCGADIKRVSGDVV